MNTYKFNFPCEGIPFFCPTGKIVTYTIPPECSVMVSDDLQAWDVAPESPFEVNAAGGQHIRVDCIAQPISEISAIIEAE